MATMNDDHVLDTWTKGAVVNTYRCNHCGQTVERDSEKRWIRSLCERTGRMTRLWRQS